MASGVQLLTYADRFGGQGLRGLHDLLTGPLEGLFSGVHVLPFYYPIDGADAGFDPIDHLSVDERVGNWDDVRALTEVVDVTADLVVNHISADSVQFRDYLEKGRESDYSGMFLTVDKVFEGGVAAADFRDVYRPRPTEPYVIKRLGDGARQALWTTFTAQQIDIDVSDDAAQAYLNSILDELASAGVMTVRLDAIGYAVKTAGTSCFMTPGTYRFIDEITSWTRSRGMHALAEIHAHHRHQIAAAKHVDYVYDFALPPLILHTLFESDASALRAWLDICPQNAITVLDTHDGIGVMDVGADALDPTSHGLVDPEFIDSMVEKIHSNSDGVSKQASQQDVGNLDLYQVNCTYYDALGRDDTDYLLARMIQFFAPGCPQVYYVGLLAGENDRELLTATRWGRDVNRRYYSRSEIERQLERPVVRALTGLIRFRNHCQAFNGSCDVLDGPDHILHIRRHSGDEIAELVIDLAARQFEISHQTGERRRSISELGDLNRL